MGNHEWREQRVPVRVLCRRATRANFSAYMAALRRPLPYYANDVQTSAGLARFV